MRFRVGQKVKCISSHCGSWSRPFLEMGRIYTVSHISTLSYTSPWEATFAQVCEKEAIHLSEITDKPTGFAASRFDPVKDGEENEQK